MPRALRTLQFVIQAAIVGLALAFIATRLWPARFGAGTAGSPAAPHLQDSYAPAVARAVPAVVNIYTGRVVEQRAQQSLGDPQLDRSAGISPYARRRLERSVGAGVFVRPDGYVLTNNHVVLNADSILVGLSDGRLMAATLVGKDSETDLAVLKVEGSGYPVLRPPANLHVAVGDIVLAVGNPLGMGQSVTLGIVSAIGRNLANVSSYEDFIQTDAAINFGSSGGALVDSAGELVGINTATGRQLGAQGISFAIPVSTALGVMDEVIAHGYVTRGWMGSEYADPTSVGLAVRGAVIVQSFNGTPAQVAGLRPGDVLTRFDGADIDDPSDLLARESKLKPGTAVEIEGLRDGLPFKMKLVLVQRDIPGRG